MNLKTDEFIDRLRKRLEQPLPGEERQFMMAPLKRERIADVPIETRQPRKSAVLILLFPENGILRTVLIERPVYEGIHSGQVAFPGGKFDEEDKELVNTALREANEELGILTEEVTILGHLTELYITPSNFLVTPFIGFTDKVPVFVPDPREVGKLITIDIELLNDISIKGIKTIVHSSGIKIKTPYYDVEGLTVWGATAMIISELNAVIEESKTIS
jgi:8-oxo-dGTP pyrophosphatase MutT (NUDIX family)